MKQFTVTENKQDLADFISQQGDIFDDVCVSHSRGMVLKMGKGKTQELFPGDIVQVDTKKDEKKREYNSYSYIAKADVEEELEEEAEVSEVDDTPKDDKEVELTPEFEAAGY